MGRKIEHEGNGYKITCAEEGLGTIRTKAKNIEEAKLAVEHYFDPHHGQGPVPGSPFCRDMVREGAWS